MPRCPRPASTPSTTSCSSRSAGSANRSRATLTVMLRSQGVPARLATGYLAGRTRPRVGRVEGARQRCPRLGRSVVPGDRLAGVRPDRRRCRWPARPTPARSAAISSVRRCRRSSSHRVEVAWRRRRGCWRLGAVGCHRRAATAPPAWPMGSAPGPLRRTRRSRHGPDPGSTEPAARRPAATRSATRRRRDRRRRRAHDERSHASSSRRSTGRRSIRSWADDDRTSRRRLRPRRGGAHPAGTRCSPGLHARELTCS